MANPKTRLPEDQSFALSIRIKVSLEGDNLKKFVRRANDFKNAYITVIKGSEKADAKQTLGISSLNINGGDELIIVGRGDERAKAVKALQNLLNDL